MSKQPYSHSAPVAQTKAIKVTSSKPPSHAEEHDEWLLDEALTETFPASDAIAISLYGRRYPLRTRPTGRAGKIGVTGRISDCSIGYGTPPEALETAIECEYCRTRIPATVALSFEGADYIYHFCGPQCLETWCNAAIRHDE